MSELPRIAWFTPLRPIESGISLYNEELLAILGGVWRIDVFVDDYRPVGLADFGTLRLVRAKTFHKLDRRAPYDLVVYQMGNSASHAYMYQQALERPGLLVLHDTLLHHLVLAILIKEGGIERYRREMSRRYGEAGEEAAEYVRLGQFPSRLFRFPLSEELIGAARRVVVHSQFARDDVLRRNPEADVVRVPMGIRLPPLIERTEARRRLGLPEHEFLLSSVTLVNPYKRIDVVLRALQALRRERLARLVLAGGVSPLMPLERLVHLYGLDGIVEARGFVDDRTARLLVAAADACPNLRFPTAGETSASLLRTMAAGRAVLVTDAGAFRELPDGAVAKVPVDVIEDDTIVALLRALATSPELKAKLERNARRFIEAEHSLGAMVGGYHRVVSELCGMELPLPLVGQPVEDLKLDGLTPPRRDPLFDEVGAALAELGLAHDGRERAMMAAASAAAELGLVPREWTAPPENTYEQKGAKSNERAAETPAGADDDQR